MNEETIIEKRPTVNGTTESEKESSSWKQISLGGVSGVLLGAGLMYAGNAFANNSEDEVQNEDKTEGKAEEAATETTAQVAEVNDNMSFSEAFAAARAQVGAGGVFEWHGGVYGTYYANEWNAMTAEQKEAFAESVPVTTAVSHVQTPTDAQPQVVVVHEVHAVHDDITPATHDANVHATSNDNDVSTVSHNPDLSGFEQDSDVHIVGVADVEGHLMVGYDTVGDGQADIAIIDVDDSGNISNPDIIMDDQGHIATIGDVTQATATMTEQDYAMQASLENPDVAPDMPDYMDDANIDDMDDANIDDMNDAIIDDMNVFA